MVHVAVITFERAEAVLSLAAHVVLTPGSERTITDLLPDAGISGKTDFFAAGGDSLAAATALLEAEATFGVRLPLTVFAAHPTLAALAKVIGAPGE